MKNNKYIKIFRVLAGFFDLSIIYIVSFVLIIFPLSTLYIQLINNRYAETNTIINLCIMIGISLVFSFLYLFIPTLVFKGSPLGSKIFFLRFVDDSDNNIKLNTIFKRTSLVLLFFIFTLGLSLISDIICIVIDKNNRTLVDRICKIHLIKMYEPRE